MPFRRSTPLSSSRAGSLTSSTFRQVAAVFSTAAEPCGPPSTRPVLGDGFCGLDRRRHLTAAHDADGIGDVHDLAQLVGDQDDGFAFFLQTAQDTEQLVGLRRGSKRLWARPESKYRLGDRAPSGSRRAAACQRRYLRSGVRDRRSARIPAARFNSALRALRKDVHKAAILGAQNDVSPARKVLDQLEMLEHHPDASANRGLAVRDCRFCRR